MADISLYGYTAPSQPNTGFAVFDVDYSPQQTSEPGPNVGEPEGLVTSAYLNEQFGDINAFYRQAPTDVAGVPVQVVSAVVSPGTVTLTLDTPLAASPGPITHGGSTVDVTSLAVSGFSLIQSVKGVIRRISKLNRGAN